MDLYVLHTQATLTGYLERFSLKTHWYLYDDYDSYNPVKGFLVMWLSLTATFLWNFTDLFIMLVSSALAAQFKKLTKSMHSVRGQVSADVFKSKINKCFFKYLDVLVNR